MKIAFTVCNRFQLPHALVLAKSFKKYHPDRKFFLGWVDRMKIPQLPEWVEVVAIESLGMTDWADMEKRYFDFELVAACKPFFARHLLTTFPDCQELVFLSPTILLYDSLDLVAVESAFLQLSPQRLRPIVEADSLSASRLDDKRILNTGMYHADSWVLHPDGQENALISWWCQRMTDRGFLDLCRGMCLDQLWMNFLPCYFERVEIIRNPGWNYGLQAVPGSELTLTGDSYSVDGVPIITLDFAGLESFHPIWSDHADLVKGRALWSDLRQSYRNSLRESPLPSDELSLPYGNPAPVKPVPNRRRRAIRLLEKVIARIETINLTYN